MNDLGYPRRMRTDKAASYLDVSKTYFLEQVANGTYPKPHFVEGRLKFWDRKKIDQWLETSENKGRQVVDL